MVVCCFNSQPLVWLAAIDCDPGAAKAPLREYAIRSNKDKKRTLLTWLLAEHFCTYFDLTPNVVVTVNSRNQGSN